MESCLVCTNSYQDEALHTCLVVSEHPCRAIFCYSCLITMCHHKQRCACGSVYDPSLLTKITFPSPLKTKAIQPRKIRRRCTCLTFQQCKLNFLFWCRTLAAFCMGACLLPPLRIIQLFLSPGILGHIFHLAAIIFVVLPAIRHFQDMFRNDHYSAFWAFALFVFVFIYK